MPPLAADHPGFELSWSLGADIVGPLLLGSMVLGIPAAIIGYSLSVRLIPSLKQCKITRWPRRMKH
jgi:uncharacterized protein (DUF2062 family)